ncbi:DUF475 domain-containing protein [bacterium]|nr:DUF475 domain-containing protein [bacterium]
MKNKSSFLQAFGFTFFLSFLGLMLAGYLGYLEGQTLQSALQFMLLASILAILEITISFDNAVIDASIVKQMTPLWQKRFLTWGIFIAVFGMRLVFPILIVSIAAHVTPWDAISLAIFEQKRYAEIMQSIHHEVAAFGGTFLALVSLSYFIDHEKDTHWIGPLEKFLRRLGALKSTEVALILLFLWWFSGTLPAEEGFPVFKAGIAGVITFLGVKLIGDILSLPEGDQVNLNRQSLGLFLYVEVLDASFSFDGVIAAFAITTNPFLIAIGLGTGALFMRSFIILMVREGTLQAYKYLEHGAFWAIGLLAAMMFIGIHVHVSEVITGGAGLLIIGSAFLQSVFSQSPKPETSH